MNLEAPSMTENHTRIDWIDMAKGYGMLLVIFGHLGVGLVSDWIYTFHMPLFFFLSGYVFSTKYDFKTFLKRKCKSIIIPYFSLGFVMALFQIFYSSIISHNFEIHNSVMFFVKLIVQRRFWTLWYIACLFWLNIVFYTIVKKCKSMKVIGLIVLGMLLIGLLYYHYGGVALPWNIDVVLTASIFFFAGYWFKTNYEKIRNFFTVKKSVVFFLLFATINVAFGYLGIKIAGEGLQMFESSYGFPPFTILSAFAGIFCAIIFSHWFTVKCIKYIGRNSMIYFAWHQTIMVPVVHRALKIVGISASNISNIYISFAERLFEMILIVLILTVCNVIISKTKLKFMLGR